MKALKTLFVEDRPEDVELAVDALTEDGFEVQYEVVSDPAAFAARVAEPWDVIICDFSILKFNAFDALRLAADQGVKVPFVILSGSIGDETAVECIKQGATDYVLKNNLTRLRHVIHRALSQRATEDRLRHAQETIREQAALLDKALDAIIVWDLTGKVLFWNTSAVRYYEYSRTEALGRDLSALIYKDSTPFHEAIRTLTTQDEWVGVHEHISKSGKISTVEGHWSLVRDSEGKPKSVLAINSDITEKRRTEAQYLRSQRLESIGTLAGGIAHDLNNVLAPILMSIELLKSNAHDDEDLRMLDTIETSAQRGADMVKQVLSFARGFDGTRLLINPLHLVSDVQRIIRDTFPKTVRFCSEMDSKVWTITGDATQLHQVLLNLCVNARDAMPSGGVLKVQVENSNLDDFFCAMNSEAKPGPYVIISVIDTGSGIPPEVRDRIFEPFFTTKEIGKGTGLGLSTVQAIMKSHGGFVTVYSEAGKGSTFRVHIPANPASRPAEPTSVHADLPRGHGETVLIVDDESAIRTITRQTLEAFGYAVLTANDGVEAISVYARSGKDIAVVLTDMMMPVLDGAPTIHALRNLNPTVKIIAASGLTENGNLARANGGVNAFLYKPFTAETLIRTINDVLSNQPASGPDALAAC